MCFPRGNITDERCFASCLRKGADGKLQLPQLIMSDARRQRAVLYPHQRRKDGDGPRGSRQSTRPALPVPSWFDLPVLLPESNVVAARMAKSASVEDFEGDRSEMERFPTPKVSRLKSATDSPVVPVKSSIAAMRMKSPTKINVPVVKSYMKRKNSTRRLDGLPVDRGSRLRARLWKDLDRFGLWHFADEDAAVSIDQTADAIMAQWQENETPPPEKLYQASFASIQSGHGDFGDFEELSASEPVTDVFLTSVPAARTQPTQLDSGGRGSVPHANSPRSNSFSVESINRRPELDRDLPNDDVDDVDEQPSNFEQERGYGSITLPGMKRRQRLKDLHLFVETQLQKRLLKSWETIEVAFTGSGDMTISQIVKFLQHSDVQLGTADADKVKAILEQHATLTREDEENQQATSRSVLETVSETTNTTDTAKVIPPETANARSTSSSTIDMKKVLFSYEGFRQIFKTRNAQDESRWKREFERERSRKRQEKEIYDRELAALEERGGHICFSVVSIAFTDAYD